MKKLKLFLAAFAAMVGLSASAQTNWTGVSEITSGQEYYIVNDATGFFVTPGNNWGTRATLDESPAGTARVTLADGKYTIIFTWPSGGNGLFVNTDDGSEVFCDRNNQANYFWTINSNGDNTFSIQLASDQARYKEGSYLTAESASIWANVQYNSGNESLRKWRFISPTEVKNSMSSSTSKLDVSLFVHGSQGTTNIAASNNSLDRFKVRYSWTITGDNWKGQNNQTLTGFNKYWLECWSGGALTSRSATKTISSLPAGSYTLSAYTVGGNGVTFFAKVGDAEKITAATGNGSPILSTINFDIESESSDVQIGIESTAESTSGWIAIDNIKLEYVSFSAFRSVYEEALQAAQDASAALDGFSVYATQKTTLDGSISSNTLTGDDLNSRSALTAATTALENATAAVAAQVAACQQYANIASAIAGGTNVDLTSYVVNAGFEQGNLNGWTSADAGGIANNANFSQKVGTYFVERWQANGDSQVKLSDGTLTHDPIVLPAGIYQISATGQVQEQKNGTTGGGYFLCANSERVEMGAPARYSTYVVVEDKSELVIKFALDGCTGNWISCDDVQLTYVGSDFPAYTLVEGKMSSAASTAQSSAESTYLSDKTVTNYNALLTAITAAQASKDAYAVAASAVADAKTLQTNYTFVTPAAAATFAEAIAAIETPYNEGSLADADANSAGRTLGVAVVGWHADATNTAASNYMISAWPSTYTINDWSIEGDSDGSNFHVPFFQDWVADGESLAAKTMTGTLSGLENGLYSVTAWVRVRAKNETAVAEATGITMDVNAGTAVDVTEGTQVGETQFQLKEYTAEGLVKDGKLTLNFNVAADNNISWLAFKNVKYTKVRDLTAEEAAVVPTGVTLDKTEATLTVAEPTVTLTPTFEPENATNTVTWTSSDVNVATVADGVVTAVSSGTTTITVKSTLDENVSASATVTVSFPETEVAAYTNDGATRYVHHYGDNIIKNGTFQYPNPFQGWKSGANGNCDANNFNIVTEDENKYIQAKQSNGAGDSHSISTGWPIEAGKTYVFGYKVKASKAGTMQYLVTSLTNSIGTETAQLDTENERKAKSVTTSWTDVKYEFTNSDNYAFVQFRARWMADSQSFDDFYLVEKTADDDVIGNVQYALDAIPTANIGTGAFQYSQDAIDAANALVQGTATVADVEAAYAALTTVNAPAEGQLFNVVLTYGGWTYDNKAMTYIANGRTDGGNYNIQYKEVANQNLAQAFTFTKVEGNNYKMSQIDADGVARYISTGVPYSGNTSQIRTTTNADQALVVTVIPTATEGKWNLRNTEANQYIGSQDAGVYTVNSHIDFVLVETQKPSITINTTAAGWGTTMLPFAVSEIPEGVKVYTCAETVGATLTLVEVNALEANKPYIIEGAWNETLTGDAQGTALSYTEGLLTGVYAQTPAPVGSYVLQKLNDTVAFYEVAEGKQPKVGANRAYLNDASAEAGIKAFYLGGDADAIKSVFDGLVNGDAYDLGGRKVNKLQKGNVYIVNGKKVVVK